MNSPALLAALLLASTLFAAETASGPAPQEDRVGFPKGYQTKYEVLRTVVHAKESKVVTIYGNSQAASATNLTQIPYPYGSIIVMETSSTTNDAKGGFGKDKVSGLHVMRKEKDFGAAYSTNRSGEWEYVEYRADGTHITPPSKSASCSECHIKAGADKDFVYHGRF